MKGPDDGSELTASNYVLYAIGGGKLAAMDPSFPDQIYDEPFKVSQFIKLNFLVWLIILDLFIFFTNFFLGHFKVYSEAREPED